jgi:hypothetical protein
MYAELKTYDLACFVYIHVYVHLNALQYYTVYLYIFYGISDFRWLTQDNENDGWDGLGGKWSTLKGGACLFVDEETVQDFS